MAPWSPKWRKKQRGRHRHEGRDEPLVCIDALALVMDFLAPRDLLRLAFTCKGLMNRVSIPQVVKSALFYGGRPQKTIEDLLPLMQDEKIHPVSPLRLLRLVNARRCECCNITAVREDSIGRYGVAFCHRRCLDPCENDFGGLGLYPVGDDSNEGNDVCEVFPYWERLECLYRTDYASFTGWDEVGGFQRNDGTKCGPLFAVREVELAIYGPARWRSDRWNERERELASKTREQRMKELLEDRLPPPSTCYEEFVKTYEKFQERAEERLFEREQARKRKREERCRKRQERLRRELQL